MEKRVLWIDDSPDAMRKMLPGWINKLWEDDCRSDIAIFGNAAMDEENFEEREYPENFVPAGTDFALFVDGNSMSPVYVNEQVVFVQHCDTVRPGRVGIFSIDNEVVIKIYDEQEPDESCKEEFTDSSGFVHPQVVLRSYNSDWQPRPVSPYQEFHVFGRVLN